ncbi:DUF58 domain-containing protein [Aliikangiella sp. IMCC44653]
MQTRISPKSLAKIKDMSIVAKATAEGFLHGIHSSQQRGIGMEFSQYRSYQIGDPLSLVDWKLFARSDRYYVREAQRESEVDIWFILDTSDSMAQPSGDSKKQWSKLDYCKNLIASISLIACRQGDSVGVIRASDQQFHLLPANNGEAHWRKILLELNQTQAQGVFKNSERLLTYLSQINKPSLIFFISDFYQQESEIFTALKSINRFKSEVVAFQATSNLEADFPFKGIVRFKDSETQREVLATAEQVKNSYLANYQQFIANLAIQLKGLNISYTRFNIDEPFDEALEHYLVQRQRIRHSR